MARERVTTSIMEMEGFIETWANQIVHSGIDDDEGFFTTCLFKQCAGKHDTGIGDDAFARLKNQLEPLVFKQRHYPRRIIRRSRYAARFVVGSIPAAEVKGLYPVAVGPQLIDQGQDLLYRISIRVDGLAAGA